MPLQVVLAANADRSALHRRLYQLVPFQYLRWAGRRRSQWVISDRDTSQGYSAWDQYSDTPRRDLASIEI